MSFLKNILGAFVEFKEEVKPLQPQADKAPKPVTAGSASAGNAADIVTGNSSQYDKHFAELIEEANNKNPFFQGTDFKEFIDSKADVEGIADEPTRYRTAFNVLKRAGLTKDKLVSTGREYVNVIN